MKLHLSTAALLVGLVQLFSTPAVAQGPSECFGPDGLDADDCCAPVTLDIPQLPPFVLPASGLCWEACADPIETCVELSVGPGLPTPKCGTFRASLDVRTCAGTDLMKGDLVLDYTRTWEEREQPGAPVRYQVWRFAAKIDLTGDFEATPDCPVPPSLVPTATGAEPTAFFYGYYDLALDCQQGAFEHVLVLFHNCDAFQHAPGISVNPGVFNPTTTYALVGPDTAANPFVPVAFPTPGGLVTAEALRSTPTAGPGICRAEDDVLQGIFQPLGSGCLCPLSFASPQQTASVVEATATCGSAARSLDFYPVAPWLHFVSTSLGGWTTGASYPGPERVAVGEGLFLYRDVCVSSGAFEQSLDVFYGGLTFDGFFVPPIAEGGLPPKAFIDLASNYSFVLPGQVPLPLVGKVWPTEHLIYLNH